MDAYLILLETAHGTRYWRTTDDPDTESDYNKRVIPFACNDDEDPDDLAATVAANFNINLNDETTWIF